jgi:hypothetical protein
MAIGQQSEVLLAGIIYQGNALSAGRVYTYAAGTTTLTPVYTDADLTIQAANPIILDSQGRAVVYANGNYKFVVKDSNDSLLYTWDNLKFGNVAASGSGDFVTLAQAQEGIDILSNSAALKETRFSADSNGASFSLRKSRASSIGSNTIVSSGDLVGSINFSGANGTGYTDTASIRSYIDATPGAVNDMPGRLSFWTTADGAGSPTERVRIDSSGQVGVNKTPQHLVDIYKTSSTSAHLQVQGLNTGSGGSGKSAINLDVDGSGGWTIENNSVGTRKFTISENSGYGTSVIERFRIDGSLISTQGSSLSVTNTTYSADGTGAYFRLRKSRGATPTTNTIVQNGDEIGVILFSGANGTTFDDAAAIQAVVDAAPGATNDMPGRLSFFTKADGSATLDERLRITSAGLIGINTAAPAAQLSLNSTGNDENIISRFSNTNFGPFVILRKSRNAAVDNNTIVNNGDQLGTIRFDGANGSGYTPAAMIRALVDGAPGATNDMPGALTFSTTADGTGTLSERVRITNQGNVGVGTNNPGSTRLYVLGGDASNPTGLFYHNVASATSQAALQVIKQDNVNTNNSLIQFWINGGATGSGQITANGANAAAFSTFSDQRLKENIANLPPQLSNINALRPVEFDYKDGSGHQIGFIAQEVQEVYPELVGPGKDGMLMLTGLGPTEARLVKAIQELSSQVTALTSRVAALEGA